MSTGRALIHHGSACRSLEASGRTVRELCDADYNQVLAFLSEDPSRTVNLRGAIQDYGISNPAHRGRFFGYYEDDRLAGVALLGHIIAICAEDDALSYFAQTAAEIRAKGHVIFGPRAQVEAFWEHLARSGRETRAVAEQYWYVCQQPRLAVKQLQLQRASLEELDVVANAQADMVYETSGIDPRLADPEGFRHRVLGRIERGRIWVKIEDGKVVFKAEIHHETPDAVYLEGIWTHPDYRNRGIAKSCVAELVHRMLRKHQSICLVVEPEEKVARRVYEQVGFTYSEDYQARFLKPLPPE